MTRTGIFLLLLILFAACTPVEEMQAGFEHFVRAEGDRLMDGYKEYRFISFNIPNLHMIEDQMPFDEIQVWRLPNTYELNDAFASIAQMGGQVVRIYTITVKRPDDLPGTPKHVLGPGQFNEEAFQALDSLMALAAKHGVRVIIPFVDNWPGFSSGSDYDEINVMNIMRHKAFEIRGERVPAIRPPKALLLLPVDSPAALNWQGSAGAFGYDIQRRQLPDGGWITLATKVSDADEAYRALYVDTETTPDEVYEYRVRARNTAGVSKWSNASGPVNGIGPVFVDPMKRTAQIFTSGGKLEFTKKKRTSGKRRSLSPGRTKRRLCCVLPAGSF